MKICVVLPFPSDKPIGGFKIVYHYCDLLVTEDPYIKIDILYGVDLPKKQNSRIKQYLKKIYYTWFPQKFYTWFPFQKNNNIHHNVGIDIRTLEKSDLIFVTSVTTATLIETLNLNKPVFYFIQGFETWIAKDEELYDSYHYGFKNIVVSKYLKNILLDDHAMVDLHLPNPIDDVFRVDRIGSDRDIQSIIFMYHEDERKGSTYIIDVVKKLRQKYPDLKVSCFSVYDKPSLLPSWIEYYKKPSRVELNQFMNEHFMFINASLKEGYGLTPAEAMGSGCCVITTDCGGVDDFAIDNETAYFVASPPNTSEIIGKVEYIFDHRDEAIDIAYNGSKKIKEFTWDDNVLKLISLMDDVYEK